MKFLLENVGSTSYENILTRKFCNSVARAREETHGESNWHGRVFRVFEATTYIKKYGRRQLESRWCAKESPKMLPIDTL